MEGTFWYFESGNHREYDGEHWLNDNGEALPDDYEPYEGKGLFVYANGEQWVWDGKDYVGRHIWSGFQKPPLESDAPQPVTS